MNTLNYSPSVELETDPRLVHAFHCTDPTCQQETCTDTKEVLKMLHAHVQECPTRQSREQQEALPQQGALPQQQTECYARKLHDCLLQRGWTTGQRFASSSKSACPSCDTASEADTALSAALTHERDEDQE